MKKNTLVRAKTNSVRKPRLLMFNPRLLTLAIVLLSMAVAVFSAGALASGQGNMRTGAPSSAGEPQASQRRKGTSPLDNPRGNTADIITAPTAPPFFQGFETDNSGWNVFGGGFDATRVASGTNGVTSLSGSFHAQGGSSATNWGGYSAVFPPMGYTTSVGIYLDMASGAANDTRFDFSSAINDNTGNFRRDFVFNAGFYNDTDGTGTGPRIVVSASNNAGRASSFPKNPGRDPFAITATGWYTFRHRFYNNGGVLLASMSIYGPGGVLVHTWTLSDPGDVITVIGGNRYGWFASNEFSFLAFDNSSAQLCSNNVALASFGATASATSEYNASFPASGLIDGEHDGNNWGAGGAWNDATLSTFPDNIQVNFNVVQNIGAIDVYTLKDDFNSGSTVNSGTTFGSYGATDFNVQYWNGAAFVDVPGGAVTGNNLVKRTFVFPEIATNRIRVIVNDSADHAFSRLVEVEAYSCDPVPVPPQCNFPANNVALASFGGTATASSEFSANFPASGVIDGEHNGNNWGSGGGWNDATTTSFPDNVDVNFNISQTINEIHVYTLKDDINSGSSVNDTTEFVLYGITDFQVQYWNGSTFVDIPGGNVTGNTFVKRAFVFPAITTDQIRVLVNDGGDHFLSRVVEIEAFSCSPVAVPSPSPTPTATPTPSPSPSPTPCSDVPANNVARSANGSTAVASSTVNANFPAAGAIDGEHNGNNWGSGGGWNDGTFGVFPDNLQVNFVTSQAIGEIDVYTLKDDFNSGSTVNDATTFTSYGITNFNVQYWTGAAWVDVPGGAVTGNNLVKRKFTFPDITTDRIRVVVNDSADHVFSRVVEIEAFSCAPVPVLCVNPGGTGGCYNTIQGAINAASPGALISVQPGTYDEDVNINKAGLKVIGAGAGSTNVRGPIGGPGSTMAVTANNVTIAGFTITRLGNNTTDWNNPGLNTVGISVQGQSITGMLVRDNLLTGNRTGIDVNNSNGHTVRNNVIDFNRTGFIYGNQTDYQTVVENFITNNWTVGVLFLDRSGAGVPPQQALHSTFSNNNISANWYGQIVDRQSGGTLPTPGTTNYKNFRGNWYGTTSPVVTTANSAEPGYAAQIPVAYGGSATPPGGQPDIAGPASANFQYTPFLTSGTDTNVETTPGWGTFGFQGVPNTVVVSPGNQNGWVFFDDFPGMGTGTGGFEAGPATPPLGAGSAYLQVDANGRHALATGGYGGTRMDDLMAFLYGSYMNGNANVSASIAFQFDIDYDLNDADGVYAGRLVYEPGLLAALPQNVWQTWDAKAGMWYGTRTTVIVNNTSVPQPCQMATPCTFAQVISLFPNAGVRNSPFSGLIFKAGGPVGSNFDGNVDAFTLRHNGALIKYNFEATP